MWTARKNSLDFHRGALGGSIDSPQLPPVSLRQELIQTNERCLLVNDPLAIEREIDRRLEIRDPY